MTLPVPNLICELPVGTPLKPEEVQFAERWITVIYGAALRGSCQKTRRGAILLRDGRLVGKGGASCVPGCYPSCKDQTDAPGDPSRHAEVEAVRAAGDAARGASLLHLKFGPGEGGVPLPSKRRGCSVCLETMRAAGVCELVLFHEDGWWRYPLGEAVCRAMMPAPTPPPSASGRLEPVQTRPLLFLDIDGVLNGHDLDDESGVCLIKPECVHWLNRIIRATDCDVVLISAWRYQILKGATTLLGFHHMLRSHGVSKKLRLVSLTRLDERDQSLPGFVENPHERAGQVLHWLQSNYIPAHIPRVVLDDGGFGFKEAGLPFVQTDRDRGLTEEKAEEVIRLLGQRPPQPVLPALEEL